MKYFKAQGKTVEDEAAWQDLENRTRKVVRGIYRTY